MARVARHRPVAVVGLLLVLLAALLHVSAPPAAAEAPCLGCVNEPPAVTPGNGGFTGVLVVPGPGGSAQPVGGAPGGGSGGDYSELIPACGLGSSGCLGANAIPCIDAGGAPYYVLYFTGPGDTMGDITGYTCLMPGQEPVSVADITGEVRQYLDELVPADPDVVVQPAGGALVRKPVLVRAAMGTGGVSEQFFTGSGFAVTVTAKPVRWTWSFGEGGSRSYPFPGAAYDGVDPSTTGRHVTHTYATAGTRSVRVTVTWTASFTLPGFGTLDAGSVDRPSQPVQVAVRTAASELVAQ